MLREPKGCLLPAAMLLLCVSPARLCAQSGTTSRPVRSQPGSRPDEFASPDALSEADMRADLRLSRVFTLDVRGVELDKILEAVSRQTDSALSVHPKWAGRRYTGMMQRGTELAFMLAVSRACHLSWRKTPAADAANPSVPTEQKYELFQTDAQQRTEKRQIAESEAREARYREELRGRLRQALQTAQSGNDPNTAALANLLKSYSPEQTERALDSALESPDFISATDQSHFHSHFFHPALFSDLTPAQQSAVRSIVDKDQYHPSYANDTESGGHADMPPNYAAMQVGLIAAAGGFRLGILEPEGKDVWVSPSVHVGNVPSLDAQAEENDLDPAVAKMLRDGSMVDLGSMPQSLKKKRVKFPSDLDRNSLSEFLGCIAEQSGLAVSCDDFLNSRATSYPNILDAKSEYTVEEALLQLAKTFGHRLIYSKGWLLLNTLTPGLDLRLEPPVNVMQRLSELQQGKIKPNLDDTLLFGACTKPQVDCILRNHPIKRTLGGLLFRAVRYHACLRFYALLPPALRAVAETATGLPYARMTRVQTTAFDALTEAGLPALNTAAVGLKSHRLYVQPKTTTLPNGAIKSGLTFLLTTGSDPPSVRRFDIH